MNLESVKALIFDVDGVFTNSDMLIAENGDHLRIMNARDGYAVRSAVAQGLHIAIITGGNSKGVRIRMQNLGIKDIYDNSQDKPKDLMDFCETHNYVSTDILYMGDDFPDFEVMQLVGYPSCPSDAEPDIINISKYISPFRGGQGCVRDIIQKTLLAKGMTLQYKL